MLTIQNAMGDEMMCDGISLINPDYRSALIQVMEKTIRRYAKQSKSIFMNDLWEILICHQFETNHDLTEAVRQFILNLKTSFFSFKLESRARYFLKQNLKAVCTHFTKEMLLIYEKEVLLRYIAVANLSEEQRVMGKLKDKEEELNQLRQGLENSQQEGKDQAIIIDELRVENKRLNTRNSILEEKCERLEGTVEVHEQQLKKMNFQIDELMRVLLKTQHCEHCGQQVSICFQETEDVNHDVDTLSDEYCCTEPEEVISRRSSNPLG